MEAARSFEILASYEINIWCHNLEDRYFNLYRRENVKSLILESVTAFHLWIPLDFNAFLLPIRHVYHSTCLR